MKSQWTVYNIDSGLITRRLVTDEESVQTLLREGESYISGHYNDNAYMIKGGKIVSRAEDMGKLRQEIAFELRVLRNEMLRESDWTQMPDAPISAAEKAQWAAYRQSLRDVPQNNPSIERIEDITWPSKPN